MEPMEMSLFVRYDGLLMALLVHWLSLLLAADLSYFREHAVAQLVEALHYKPEGRGFDSHLFQWNFSLT
jgi:hypothetical protein